MPILKMCGAIPPLFHTSPWNGTLTQEQFYFTTYS